MKSRGMPVVQGLHGFKIDRDGIHIFPRVAPPEMGTGPKLQERLSFGIPALDGMMCGGVPRGEACLIAGASGTGKSILAQHFIAEGIARGEPSVAMVFEDTPEEYAARAISFGWDMAAWQREGKLSVVYRGPMDVSVDEVIDEAVTCVERTGAKRFILDSISGFDLARSPADRPNFRESLQRLVRWVTSKGLTVMMTTEIPEVFGELRFSTQEISFVADNIILLRFVEIESALRKVLVVVKMRGSDHDKDLHHFQITPKGATVGAPLREYTGLLSGSPTLVAILGPQPFAPGLERREGALVEALFGLGTAGAEALAAETGFPLDEVERILQELVGRGYVTREATDAGPAYHVTMVSWAPTVTRMRRGMMRQRGGEDSVEG